MTYLPNITEDEVNNDSYHSNYLELQVGGDLEVEPLGEVLGAVERHEDDGGTGSHGPGTHDHCKHTQRKNIYRWKNICYRLSRVASGRGRPSRRRWRR